MSEPVARHDRLVRFHEEALPLVAGLAGRISDDDLDSLEGLGEAGEWGFFFDELSALLHRSRIGITPAERDVFVDLIGLFTLPTGHDFINDRDEVVASLNVREP
ncbi:hypothetical protein GCM10022243_27560 [Saccharothrix violaceirubra]|uniref:Uncharacterized protein n=1 Tax=Saccharothrix violaceirubra TaxID=413306 RepID=A0A7W7TA42_9PSEU|nr:hypothetical protein [Saccharothrix violaceirubra]MBB4969321.1 hypothetical protein [Saccharothrix violaceirubra]